MKSILCIVNRVSGLEKSLKVYYEVEKKIVNAGFSPKLFTTNYAGHATEYISTLKPNEFDTLNISSKSSRSNASSESSTTKFVFCIALIPGAI